MYLKHFEIRWNDLDANKHLGNSTYVEYMSDTRMSFLTSHGLSLDVVNSYGLGPIVMYEHIYYFKEIGLDDKVKVSLEVSGMSEDGRFIQIEHNFFNEEGKNLANAEMLFSWMDLKTRRFGKIPIELLQKIKNFPRSNNFKILTKEETKRLIKKPIDLPGN
ncbi:acyl-CoA thioesterase [Pontimicrobium aquaticum]|uniref:Thioesterase n=1 Tax=Pontimicrobium aquaticum TaxID=2565367 RepID=A0A4U0F2Y5_9FLAO|nr:acyl-CoA thioesterase [Pontimicrobium aquaticum]TJY38144.1 thioesterase [Pontimicrobium aquaticum]